MHKLSETHSTHVVVTGPNGFEQEIPLIGFGVVLRANSEDEEGLPQRYVIPAN